MHPPEIKFNETWFELLGALKRFWDTNRDVPALRCGFNELSEEERKQFFRTLPLQKPTLERFGEFEETKIQGVPISARTVEDAKEWSEWLLQNSIDKYVAAQEYDDLRVQAISRFPEFNLELPAQRDLSQKIRKRAIENDLMLPREYWFLQAPVDLSLVENQERSQGTIGGRF